MTVKNVKVNYVSIVAILVLLCLSYFYFFKGLIEGSKYGKSANAIRERVKIPIIESYMKKTSAPNSFKESRWESEHEKNGLIHLWKMASPNKGGYILYEERDAFRKRINDEKCWQLNINSQIIKDSVSEREGILIKYNGTLMLYNGSADTLRHLDENGLDSIFKEWALESLVKGYK